jgi:diguanylate cyclase (GGDEF)-like protein
MTPPERPTGSSDAAKAAPLSSVPHLRKVGLVHGFAFAGAIALAILTAHTAHWNLLDLATLMALAVISEITSTRLPSGVIYVSGSFLGIALGAVLLGGAPAAIIGDVTIAIGWLWTRERGESLRHNLVNYAWFPLLTGLLFHWATRAAGVSVHLHDYRSNPTYYVLILGAFMFALALNTVLTAVHVAFRTHTSLAAKLADFGPVMAADLSSAILTVVAAYLTNQLGYAGLLLFAVVLVVFQYLVGELLTSQRRGEELRLMAATDDLTGLPNRKAFEEVVNQVIAGAADSKAAFGVLLLDLDHFKDINDTLGHQYGDDLLVDLGPRLAARVGERGCVARFGGDEFAIFPSIRTDNLTALTAVVEDVLACVREEVVFEDITLQVDGSIGVARYPADGHDAQTLLRRADIAMYAAKDQRDGHRFYAPGQDRHSVSRLSMVGDFRRALETDDQILVHFHPIVDLHDGSVHGAEALVRWQHPQLGLLQPAAFLEIVEQTGLIGPMTSTVLDKAIAECAAWHAAGRDLTVSVNLSVRNLHDPMLSSYVAQMLDRHRLPAHSLKLEITESMILSDPQRALITVESLSELGVRFAVDDFGTGHSSLANLRMLPVHELKIDRSFVTPMLNEESDSVIVRSTVDLGHALGLTVIAEGVENATTLRRLEEIHCDRAQGHFFSKPVPPIEFMRWISRYENSIVSAA